MTQLAKQQNSVGILKVNNVNSKEIDLFTASISLTKIKDFTKKTELAHVTSLITKWAMLLGIDYPESMELNLIANHIKKNHPTFNLFDIEEAINMYVSGKLATDAEHFGTMSAYFISKVFNDFQKYKSTIIVKIREEIVKKERQKVIVPTEQQCIDDFKKLLRNAKEQVDNKEYYYDFGDVLYHFFWQNNLVTKPIPDDFKNEALKYAEKMIKLQSKKKSIKEVIKGLDFEKTNRKKQQIEHCKTYAVNEWLKEVNLEEIEKNITFEMIYKEIKKE